GTARSAGPSGRPTAASRRTSARVRCRASPGRSRSPRRRAPAPRAAPAWRMSHTRRGRGRRRRTRDGSRDGSYQGRLQDDAPIDDPCDLRQEAARLDGHLGTLGELAQEVDEPAHRADQITLVAAEGLLDDPEPVVLTGGPAEDGGHEPSVDAQRHLEVALALRLVDGLGEAAEPSAAASAPVRSSKRPRKTLSATSSSLS